MDEPLDPRRRLQHQKRQALSSASDRDQIDRQVMDNKLRSEFAMNADFPYQIQCYAERVVRDLATSASSSDRPSD